MKKINEMTNEELNNLLETIKSINSNKVTPLEDEIKDEINKRQERKLRKKDEEVKQEVNKILKRAEQQKSVLGNVYLYETETETQYIEVVGVEDFNAIVNVLSIRKLNNMNTLTSNINSFNKHQYIGIGNLKNFKTVSLNEYFNKLREYQEMISKKFRCCEIWTPSTSFFYPF